MVKKRGLHRSLSHPNPLHWKNLPSGIKALTLYTLVIILLYLLYSVLGFRKPVSIMFGTLITGTLATVIELISLAVLIVIVYGLIKRHFWVFYVSLVWFAFGLLNAIISLIAFRSEFDVLRTVLTASSFVIIILNGLIVWYVYSEKEFFKVKHLNKETKAKDKFFVYVISVFLIVSLLMLITFGINFYDNTIKTTNKMISELEQTNTPETLCLNKTGQERDVCYLVLSIKEQSIDSTLCDNIKSDFYKITCYRALQ